MAAQYLVRNLTEEYLTCRVCLQAFDHPRRLSCQHAFCTGCIRQLVKKSPRGRGLDTLTCPLCRTDDLIPANVPVNEFVSNLPVDSLIVDLQTTLSHHAWNPENTRSANVNRDDLCSTHPGRRVDHYCFHHARMICAACIDTSHSEFPCRSRPVKDAYSELQPRVDRLLENLHSQLNEAELETEKDRSFEKSKRKTLEEIDNLEQRLENVFETCRRQLSVLRSDVEKLNREYLGYRKDFFTSVHSLLETTSHFECLKQDKNFKNLVEVLPSVESWLDKELYHLRGLKTKDTGIPASLQFTVFDEVSEFIHRFSAIGFVELKGVKSDLSADLSHLQIKTPSSETPPLSLSHILNRRN